jgi:hypothetical protein
MTTQQLETIRDQAIANLTAATAAPKPTYTIDGQRVDHAGYLTKMQALIDWCNERLGATVEIATTAGHP